MPFCSEVFCCGPVRAGHPQTAWLGCGILRLPTLLLAHVPPPTLLLHSSPPPHPAPCPPHCARAVNVAGFIYVQDVDVAKGTITYLAPCAGALPNSLLLAGAFKTYLD